MQKYCCAGLQLGADEHRGMGGAGMDGIDGWGSHQPAISHSIISNSSATSSAGPRPNLQTLLGLHFAHPVPQSHLAPSADSGPGANCCCPSFSPISSIFSLLLTPIGPGLAAAAVDGGRCRSLSPPAIARGRWMAGQMFPGEGVRLMGPARSAPANTANLHLDSIHTRFIGLSSASNFLGPWPKATATIVESSRELRQNPQQVGAEKAASKQSNAQTSFWLASIPFFLQPNILSLSASHQPQLEIVSFFPSLRHRRCPGNGANPIQRAQIDSAVSDTTQQ